MSQTIIICCIVVCVLLLLVVSGIKIRIKVQRNYDVGKFYAEELILKGMFLDDKGKYDEAIKKFLEATEIISTSKDSLSTLCYFCLSSSYHKKGDKEESSRYLIKANWFRSSLGPESSRAFLYLLHANKAIIACENGSYDEAQKNYELALLYADEDTRRRILKEVEESQ